jgi:hypothetical protein
MVRCACTTQKLVRCKNEALEGSKNCFVHKKCVKKVSKSKKGAAPKKAKKVAEPKEPKKVSSKKAAPKWVKSKAWESPIPEWMQGAEKIHTKALSPRKPAMSPSWWLQ